MKISPRFPRSYSLAIFAQPQRSNALGRPLEAIENWKVSACKWPRGALAAASPMFHEASTRKAKREGDVLVAEFWRSINQENIGRWCFERGIDVPASVLLSQAPAISKKHTKD